jgi:hypothetical protein
VIAKTIVILNKNLVTTMTIGSCLVTLTQLLIETLRFDHQTNTALPTAVALFHRLMTCSFCLESKNASSRRSRYSLANQILIAPMPKIIITTNWYDPQQRESNETANFLSIEFCYILFNKASASACSFSE